MDMQHMSIQRFEGHQSLPLFDQHTSKSRQHSSSNARQRQHCHTDHNFKKFSQYGFKILAYKKYDIIEVDNLFVNYT